LEAAPLTLLELPGGPEIAVAGMPHEELEKATKSLKEELVQKMLGLHSGISNQLALT
jgi:hypothetical protein